MKIISLLLSYVKTFRDFFFLHFLFSIIHRFLIEIHAMLLSLFNWDSEQVHRVDIYFYFMRSENNKTKICAPCELQCVEWGQCILCRKKKPTLTEFEVGNWPRLIKSATFIVRLKCALIFVCCYFIRFFFSRSLHYKLHSVNAIFNFNSTKV